MSDDAGRARNLQRLLSATLYAPLAVTIMTIKAGLEALRHALPALLFLDMQDRDADPLHGLKQVRNVVSDVPVILVTAGNDPIVASRALRAGASAYLAGEDLVAMLPSALEHVSVGERYVTEDVMQGILHDMVDSGEGESRVPVESLSDREMMVFQLLGRGKTLRHIADELGVNIKTVATHCNNIRRKLHTPDNRHLCRISRDWMANRRDNELHHV